MKCRDLKEVVQTTRNTYSLEYINEKKQELNEKDHYNLVSEERQKLRNERLKEVESVFSTSAKERTLGLNDLVDVNYLTRALKASKAVCRVIIRDQNFRERGSASGFKVSPTLLLTNHHVFRDKEAATNSLIEFDFELDNQGNPKNTTRFQLSPERLFINDEALDYALVAINPSPVFGSGQLSDYGFLQMSNKIGKINRGEFATIIQHPSGQPKQIALRENEVLNIEDNQLLYQSDTAPGSSGSPVFNDSWQVVALHTSGIPRTNENGDWLLRDGSVATPADDDSEIDWIANAGTRASIIVNHVLATVTNRQDREEFLQASIGNSTSGTTDSLFAAALPVPSPAPVHPSMSQGQFQPQPAAIQQDATKKTIYVPVTISLSMGEPGAKPDAKIPNSPVLIPANPGTPIGLIGSVEKMPFHDTNYETRTGYDPGFLGTEVPMPKRINSRSLSKMANGDHIIPYEHFSIINNKRRKMALLTASNIDASRAKKRPEPGRTYTRAALGEMRRNEREVWFIDPRIPVEDQLSDQFYSSDRRSFDKGHIVRREDVNWGNSYAEVKIANGDTFHVTNCSPQVSGFNRSIPGGIWGRLENSILRQARTEKYCVFSGPLLLADDPVFHGINNDQPIEVQIPRAYWKMIVARTPEGELQTFSFLLAQDLSRVAFEFDVAEEFIPFRISVQELEERTINIVFPRVLKDADQFAALSNNLEEVNFSDVQ
ncbi:MAG: DNA/RNA non-specific endonuclease [Saprospiraceae bacterium]|nr:DNA/RNA non-specific endonuclease [Saprospiraceae bacterium]